MDILPVDSVNNLGCAEGFALWVLFVKERGSNPDLVGNLDLSHADCMYVYLHKSSRYEFFSGFSSMAILESKAFPMGDVTVSTEPLPDESDARIG